MSWFGSSTVTIDAQIERATDESIPFGETDLATSLEITDLIRSKQVLPKDAMRSLKKRLTSTKNPNTQLSTLHLIDTCVKNGGNHFIVEISSREFIDSIVSIIHDDKTNENVRDLSLDLIQNWAIAFKENFQFKYVVSTYEQLKSDGYNFPPIGSEISSNLFDSSAPPEWEDSDACMICSTLFSMLNRKNHCRNCGGVFCQSHSSKSLPLPHLGITEPVRVCDTCFDELSSKSSKGHKSKKTRRSKHQKEVSRARAQYDSDDDEDLKKALALSLRESQGYTQVPIPVIPPPQPTQQPKAQTVNEGDDDEDMKAAIAASLKDLEDKKLANQQQQQQQPIDNSPYANLLPQSNSQSYQSNIAPQAPSVNQNLNIISSNEESDIRQFASKVDYYKSNPSATTDMNELHDSYRRAVPLTPKLSSDLNESIDKYDKLVDMNSKIDTVMRLYNKLLDERIERESNYQRQYQQQAQYQPSSYQQYPPQANYQQQYQEPSSPEAYYRAPSQIPQFSGNSVQPQSPYQQRQQPIGHVQSPVISPQQPQQPQYSGYSQQQPQQPYQETPPAYSSGPGQYPSYSETTSQVPVEYKEEEPNEEEEEEEEDEFTAPPPVVTQEDGEQNFYEPTPQHVVQPEFTGESQSTYNAQEPLQLQQPPQPSQPSQPSQPQQYRAPQASYGYAQPTNNQYQYNQPKVTDITFPSVPMNKPPPGPTAPISQSEPPAQPKEEQLIEL